MRLHNCQVNWICCKNNDFLIKIKLLNLRFAINIKNNFDELGKTSKKKKTEKSDIVQKGRVSWTPKPYF